jgi:hypothetical protein
MTEEQIDELADEVCLMMEEVVDEYNRKNDNTIALECQVCPFRKLCTVGHSGFTEFLKQER